MKTLPRETVYHLLGTRNIPGTAEEVQKLSIRISELVEMNGQDWVIENRDRLLQEWVFAVRKGLVGSGA